MLPALAPVRAAARHRRYARKAGMLCLSTGPVVRIGMGVDLRLMGFERCKVGRPSGIRHGLSWENMPPGRSPMRQDNTSTLSGLASFAKLQGLLTARGHEGCAEAKMTFEAFEVELGHAVRGLENELKAADLARYEVDTDAVLVDGKAWRKCLEQQPK